MKSAALTQEDAHNLLRSWLEKGGENYEKALQEEVQRRNSQEELWAVPQPDRTYYTITLDDCDSPYLIVAIHHSFNISSVVKVTEKTNAWGRVA